MISFRCFKSSVLILVLFSSLFSLSNHYCQITSPSEYLGFNPGDDFHLARYEELIGYLERIATESGRIRVFDMGSTTEGRRMKYAVISSEENTSSLDRYREIVRKLSLVRNVSDREARRLASEGRVVVWIESGIHSTETSPPMHQFLLAYNLVSGSSERIRSILDNVILIMVIANPDGMTLVSDWYMKNIGTQYEMSRPPVLYHKYAGHDDNRDAFMANLVEIQNMNRIIGKIWFPELVYVQHETAPFPARIWIPPNPEPVNQNIHPIITRWKNLIGSAMGHAFDASDRPGAISRIAFDIWYPGYTDGPSVEGHNIPSILTETANHGYATPHYYRINDFPEKYRDLIGGTFYPSPWQGGWWRFRDAVDYDLTASMAVLDVAARYRYEFLYLKYKMGGDVIERFKKEPPYGWLVAADQRDVTTTILMLNRLINYGIEVYRAEEEFIQDGILYPENTYIIPTSQPFGLYVKNIMEKQTYPDLRKYGYLWQGISRPMKWKGPPLAPYEGVGWTLPVQMGVDARRTDSPLDIEMSLVDKPIVLHGKVAGDAHYYIISCTENSGFGAASKIIKAGASVSRTLRNFTYHKRDYPAGSFLINGRTIEREKLEQIASEAKILIEPLKTKVESEPVTCGRIALYKSWVPSMDQGWISYILDKYGFSYHLLTNSEVRAGRLNDRFDVLVLPDQSPKSIIYGNRKGTMPPQYVGGITEDGVGKIREFVEEGGILVCNRRSCDFAIDRFNLPIRDVLEKVKLDSFNCPGSLIRVDYDTDHPLTHGMQRKGMCYFAYGSGFELLSDKKEGDRSGKDRENLQTGSSGLPRIVARFSDASLLISGWILGEDVIRGKAAVVEVPYGKGRVVLFGFNFHNRAQSYANFKLLFNALFK